MQASWYHHDAGLTLWKATRAPTEDEATAIASIPYRRTLGELNYAMRTSRPDTTYPVSCLSRYMENPSIERHIVSLSIFYDIRGTTDLTLVFGSSDDGLIGHSDSDYAADQDDSKSTSAYVYTQSRQLEVSETVCRCNVIK